VGLHGKFLFDDGWSVRCAESLEHEMRMRVGLRVVERMFTMMSSGELEETRLVFRGASCWGIVYRWPYRCSIVA
jgi:hypothetical protein